MRVCVAYDCLFPWTVGGAERWYRSLVEGLGQAGHEVTYLTRLQWDPDDPPTLPRVHVVAVSKNEPLYGTDGNRRIAEALNYGRGVLRHLIRYGGRYDVVHTASFPYFSLLAAALARRRHRYELVVDWFEVWSKAYWREYLGPARGRAGETVQRACSRVPQQAYCFSRLHRDRLLDCGVASTPTMLAGLYAGPMAQPDPTPRPDPPTVVFAGRHIREKRAPTAVRAIVRARASISDLRGSVFGDGPERPDVLSAIADQRASEFVDAPGFVASELLGTALRAGLCLMLPSSREGYGLVVVEAAAQGCPSIVVRGRDNAAVELVEDGVNGVIAATADPAALAEAIVRIWEGGDEIRRSTCAWFAANAERLSMERSIATVLAGYESP